MHSSAKAELYVVPPRALQKFITEKLGTVESEHTTSDKGKALGDSQRGVYEFLNERDRWQLMSKELAQKQELIHQIISQTLEANKLAREKTNEVTQLRNAIATI